MTKIGQLPGKLADFIFSLHGVSRLVLGQILDVLVHGLSHLLAVGDGFHHGSGTCHHIAGGKDARSDGAAALVGNQKATLI